MSDKPFIVICAWCKDYKKKLFKVKQSDESFVAKIIPNIEDFQVSDSICPECFAIELNKIIQQKQL